MNSPHKKLFKTKVEHPKRMSGSKGLVLPKHNANLKESSPDDDKLSHCSMSNIGVSELADSPMVPQD